MTRYENIGTITKNITLANGTHIHIYPGTEEILPDNLHYKVQNRIDNDKDLVLTTGKKRKVKPYTREEAYKLNKDAQIKILTKHGVSKIPKYEKDRVALILKLQNEE